MVAAIAGVARRAKERGYLQVEIMKRPDIAGDNGAANVVKGARWNPDGKSAGEAQADNLSVAQGAEQLNGACLTPADSADEAVLGNGGAMLLRRIHVHSFTESTSERPAKE